MPRAKTSTPIDQRALLTLAQAADYMGVSVRLFTDSFLRCVPAEIKGVEIGSGVQKRYRRRDLDELIDRMESGDTVMQRTRSEK